MPRYLVLTFVGGEPSSDSIIDPAPILAEKRHSSWSLRELLFKSVFGVRGRFGHARTPNTTLPSSSKASAIAYW